MAEYYMYASRRGITESEDLDTAFLIAPFTTEVWCSVTATILAAFLLNLIFRKYQHRDPNIYSNGFFNFVTLLGCTYLAALYSSNLKAMLNLRVTNIPFKNLYDLASQIRVGSKVMVVEAPNTLRHILLAKDPRTEPFKALYHAIRAAGINRSLLIEPNMTKLCNLMDTSGRYVLFGHEDLIHSNLACMKACFWKYHICNIEYPLAPLTWLVGNRTVLSRYADLMAHILSNYMVLELGRKYPDMCGDKRPQKVMFINNRQLFLAYSLLCVGLMIGGLIFVIEKVKGKCTGKKQETVCDEAGTSV